ncbi:hypothetical protein SAMN05660976_08590 [Nonomuraea pusilla]|uniref:Helix-turn-helix domain-containing protein n=2 Tax=Nonomuraea pusilla TaxID=46177 RepID=A0A1H8KEX8_9ACTN|nr:hypothetical protein SAMN05660976_08590 [Nonomuraea pusilla]
MLASAAQDSGRPVSLNQEAIDWAWAQTIANNPGARIVLMCLARRVDDVWECTTSQEEVAVDAMLSSRSVRRHLEQLEGDGFIARRRRFDDKGHRLADRLRLNPGASLPANLSGRDESKGPDRPVAKLASGSDQQESLPARLASGQVDLWPDWPVGEQEKTDIPRSQPVAKLTSGQIGRASSSSTKNYRRETSSSSTPQTTDAPCRADVEALCNRLLSWLEKNEIRQRPTAVPDAWRKSARLLLDRDGIDLQEAIAVLDWSQRDGFWIKNIHSMPTFRKQYGRLEVKSRGYRGDATRPTAGGPTAQQPTPLPARVGGYERAKNFGRRNPA